MQLKNTLTAKIVALFMNTLSEARILDLCLYARRLASLAFLYGNE